MSVWNLFENVVDETTFKSDRNDTGRRAAIFPSTDSDTLFFAKFLAENGFTLLDGMTASVCGDYDLVLFCFVKGVDPNENEDYVDCADEQNVLAVADFTNRQLLTPFISPPRGSDYGEFLLKICHATLDVGSVGKRLSSANIVGALGDTVLASKGLKKTPVGDLTWFGSVGGRLTWHCKVSTATGDDGRRVGSYLKKLFVHGKVGYFKDFKGVYVEAASRKKGVSSDTQRSVKSFDPQAPCSLPSFIAEVESDDAAASLIQEILDDGSVKVAELSHFYKVETPFRTHLLCEALFRSRELHPDYSVRMVGTETKLNIEFSTPKNRKPHTHKNSRTDRNGSERADNTSKPTPDTTSRPTSNHQSSSTTPDPPVHTQLPQVDQQDPVATATHHPTSAQPAVIVPAQHPAVRPPPSHESAMLVKLVAEIDALKTENKRLKEDLSKDREERKIELQKIMSQLEGIKAKAADHALVEAAIHELRETMPSNEKQGQLSKEVAELRDQVNQKMDVKDFDEMKLQLRFEEIHQRIHEQAVSQDRFQQGTGLAVDKLHGQLVQLDQLSSRASQGLASQVQQLHQEVQEAAKQEQRNANGLQQLREQQRAHAAHANKPTVDMNQVRQVCSQNNDELRIAISRQLQGVERRLREAEAKAATPPPSQPPLPPPVQPVQVVNNDNNAEVEMLGAKMTRLVGDMKAIDGRVQHLELLQAEVTSLLETSATQAEKFHALDDKIDDLQITVDAISAAQQ